MDPEETEDYASTWDYFDHDLCGWDYFLENIEEILNTNFGAIEDARAEIDETAPALPDEEEETEPPAVRDAAATPTATRPYWQQ